ncbi:MAG: hypothetical protein LUQ32_10675 [Methanomicrobiales archaeon]|nr:hypothetical protein [Methanomicrobiales archaeon]
MSSGHKKGKEKAGKPEKKSSGSEKKESGSGSILAIGVVLMFLIIPIGLCFYTAPAEPYTVVPEDPLLTAVHEAGAYICDTTNTQWDVPGATGGKTYIVSYDCKDQTSSNTITVQIQAFDSQDSRDAAVMMYNTMTVGKGKPTGNLFAYNQYLIYVTPPNTPLMKSIGAELQKMKSPQ